VANVIEIECDTPRNSQLHFLPIGSNVRGRFDYSRDTEPQSRVAGIDYPEPIPGQRLGLDLDALEGYIAEPLHDKAYAKLRAVVERKGFSLPKEKEVFKLSKADVPTWLYWMKRSVEGGDCKLLRGKLPERVEGEPQKSFITKARGPDPRDAVIARLTALLMAKLSPAERKEVEAMLGE
jgi:hypothetical protein